jgi:hypothetical protein
VPKAAGTSINLALYGRTLGHYRADEIRQRFPRLFERSFVFSFVRNPWDRVLSAYRFAVKGRTQSMAIRNPEQYQIAEFSTFESFVKEWLPRQDLFQSDFVFQPQYLFISNKSGLSIVDFIGRVESLSDDLLQVESRIGLSLNVRHLNRTGEVGEYRKAYNKSCMVDIVGSKYRRDIAMFGYTF